MGRNNIDNYSSNLTNAFNSLWLVDYDNLVRFYNLIASKGFVNAIENIFAKSSNSVSSIRIYPLNRSYFKLLPQSRLRFAGKTWDKDEHPFGYGLMNAQSLVKVGRYDVPVAQSFVDYEPHTQMQLYLPYLCTYVELPVNEIVGQTLYVDYSIDFSSGLCTAYIYVLDTNSTTKIIAMKSGIIGVEVAWGSTNNADNIRNILTTLGTTAISLYTLGASAKITESAKAIGKVATISKAGLSIANSMQRVYERGGTAGNITTGNAITEPYIITCKQKLVPVDEEMYAHTYGKPLYESRVLSQIHGFTILDEIHLTGFGTATDSEINEIERLLKTGVIL